MVMEMNTGKDGVWGYLQCFLRFLINHGKQNKHGFDQSTPIVDSWTSLHSASEMYAS